MAIVRITTTYGAVPHESRPRLAMELATLTYEAEGFGGSSVAPTVSWTFFDEQPTGAFSTGVGEPALALYYVVVTVLAGAIGKSRKHELAANITSALLAREDSSPGPENKSRVWVRFVDVADGDLVVGGEPASLASLKALIAQGR